MRVARIKDNKVVNIEISNETSSDLVEIGDTFVDIGYSFIEGVFAPCALSLEETLNRRKVEYPPLEDLADAIYWQSKGDSSKMTEYLAKCEAVKLKYPKVT